MGVHTDRSTVVLVVLTFMHRPHISLTLFSSWLLHDNQSLINSSGPCLYSMHFLYCCMHRIIHCRYCDSIATSLFIMATNNLWSMMTHTSHAKWQWWNFSQPCRILSASLSVLLYHCSMLEGSCWQMEWTRALHCLILHHIQSLVCPLNSVVKCPGLLPMH